MGKGESERGGVREGESERGESKYTCPGQCRPLCPNQIRAHSIIKIPPHLQ